jgi:Tol biopolymer transport system component
MLVGYNFLTFSPDGKYIALSNQGYIAKYDKNGNERSEWGHEPSTTVSISLSAEPDKIECVYNDLSEIGIYGSLSSKTVASVSFANNNSRLMMVGNDETVVIRNLHL